ncbi:hypothetical protein JKP88DRAFT_249831 [Tribonema minus]|uniref:Uncharacterized protein n=1 Tax=Tribonema minus TaxID=303371 RepID=A0A835YRW6_9STRA|nr:hypothetical protein JKP88DRAFT_249831 [Tribonema minus]
MPPVLRLDSAIMGLLSPKAAATATAPVYPISRMLILTDVPGYQLALAGDIAMRTVGATTSAEEGGISATPVIVSSRQGARFPGYQLALAGDTAMRTVGATTVGGGVLMTEVDIYCPYPYQWRDFMAALNTCTQSEYSADACSVMSTVGSACIRITTPCGMHFDAVGIYRVPVMRKLREVSVLLHAQAVANPDNGLTTC